MSTEDEGRSQAADNSGAGKAYFFNLAHETKQAQLLAINLEQKLFKILANQCQPQADGKQEPSQYLHGNRLLLPHFTEPREYSPERVKILNLVWGDDGKTPPAVKWAEINTLANTGYSAFGNAFEAQMPDLFCKAGYGKYRLRRDP